MEEYLRVRSLLDGAYGMDVHYIALMEVVL